MTLRIDLDRDGEDDLEIKGVSKLGEAIVVIAFHVLPWLSGALIAGWMLL